MSDQFSYTQKRESLQPTNSNPNACQYAFYQPQIFTTVPIHHTNLVYCLNCHRWVDRQTATQGSCCAQSSSDVRSGEQKRMNAYIDPNCKTQVVQTTAVPEEPKRLQLLIQQQKCRQGRSINMMNHKPPSLNRLKMQDEQEQKDEGKQKEIKVMSFQLQKQVVQIDQTKKKQKLQSFNKKQRNLNQENYSNITPVDKLRPQFSQLGFTDDQHTPKALYEQKIEPISHKQMSKHIFQFRSNQKGHMKKIAKDQNSVQKVLKIGEKEGGVYCLPRCCQQDRDDCKRKCNMCNKIRCKGCNQLLGFSDYQRNK